MRLSNDHKNGLKMEPETQKTAIQGYPTFQGNDRERFKY